MEDLYDQCTHPVNRAAFSEHLASIYTAQKLAQHLLKIKGVFQNTVALGVFLVPLWNVLDCAWEVMLTALARSTGQYMHVESMSS